MTRALLHLVDVDYDPTPRVVEVPVLTVAFAPELAVTAFLAETEALLTCDRHSAYREDPHGCHADHLANAHAALAEVSASFQRELARRTGATAEEISATLREVIDG